MRNWFTKRALLSLTFASVLTAFFIISLGRNDSIFELFIQPYFYPDLLFVSLIVFTVLAYIWWVHKRMDARYPLHSNLKLRIGYQAILGLALPSLLSLLLGYLYLEKILGYQIEDTSFYYYEYPIAIIIVFAINLIFIIYSLVKGEDKVATQPERKKILIFSQGNQKVPVPVDQIGCILKEGEFGVAYTFDSRQFIVSESLDEMADQLDQALFFRANRQSILHYKVCGAYKVNRSGKIDLTLAFLQEKQITISQKRAPEFKSWLKSH